MWNKTKINTAFILSFLLCIVSLACNNSQTKKQALPQSIEEYDQIISGIDKTCDGTICFYKKGQNLNHFFFSISKSGTLSELFFNFKMPRLFGITDIQLCVAEDCISILSEPMLTKNYIPFPLKHLNRILSDNEDHEIRFTSQYNETAVLDLSKLEIEDMDILSSQYKKIVNVQ